MDPSGKTLEEKIANIKFTLKELGQSLEHEEKYERIPASPKDKPQDSSFSYKPRVIQEKVDLKLLYTYEKERNSMLEARIMQKDELVSEMTSLQNDLYINLEELQSKVSMLESDLAFLRRQNLSLNEEIQSFSDLLHSKDLEISRLVEEKDKYFSYLLEKDEESRLLNDELQTQEPDKRLIQALEKRNQELLLEINNLQHHLSQINTNQFQVLALQEKLRKSEEKIETIVEFHSKEKTGLLKKIQELEKQSNELKPQLDLNKFKSNYFELLGLLDVYDGGHQEAVQKIQEMLCKSLETTKLSNITENLCDELGVQTDQIVTKVKGIQENTKIERKLYQKLADLLVQCSPKGKFNGLPSCQQVWKWVTRILEDYMSIKKELKL